MNDPNRVRVTGPLALYAEGFREGWRRGATRPGLWRCSSNHRTRSGSHRPVPMRR